MPENITLEDYKKVYHEVAKKDRARSFYLHLTIYLSINTISAIINIMLTPQFVWVIFPIIFWGIGVIWNYVSSFILIDSKLKKLSLKTEIELKRSSDNE
ncbi:2TM domain-containing protein [Methanobacterium alcaliphilum]|uniref:2TM domain-containing protein n=1 Tax=Methanobacterium alcaliphilum TaxID=392018 RepID=UPI00200A02DB|nr:2TM domain-containing protein [Methanobacterium alcaliphilum]MCK9150698.1 2TM domain-containing protein [Methanobacterium alcaliphilum]